MARVRTAGGDASSGFGRPRVCAIATAHLHQVIRNKALEWQ